MEVVESGSGVGLVCRNEGLFCRRRGILWQGSLRGMADGDNLGGR